MIKRVLIAVGAVFALVGAMLAHTLPAHAQTGFHISDGRLVDSAGNDFVMRGVSHAHTWYAEETGALADIKSLGANTVRVVLSSGDHWDENSLDDVANVVQECKANQLICMLEVHDTTGYGEDEQAVDLDAAVDYWLRIQDAVQGEEDHVLVNIGNEPYGNDEEVNQDWALDTSAAIDRLRQAGFEHTLVVDAPNWGQDWQHIMRDNAADVFASDPNANTMFSIHMYGVYEEESVIVDYLESFTNAGLPLLVGEFGHFHSDGDPDEDAIMAHTERLGLGYIGWSWSGNSEEVGYLDMAIDFDPDNLSEWGERIFNGPDGIAETSVEAPVYGDTEPTDPPTETPEPTPTPTDEPAEYCTAEYVLVEETDEELHAEIEVTAGPEGVDGWMVDWTWPNRQEIQDMTGAVWINHGWHIEATSLPDNSVLEPGESATFELTATHGGVNIDPRVYCQESTEGQH